MSDWHEFTCDSCGSDILIVEYYNTEMDHDTMLDIMTSMWVSQNFDCVERVECVMCSNAVYRKEQ